MYMLTYKDDQVAKLGEVDTTNLGLFSIDLFEFNPTISQKKGEKRESILTCTRHITLGEGGVSHME